jgi:hypothetical protein
VVVVSVVVVVSSCPALEAIAVWVNNKVARPEIDAIERMIIAVMITEPLWNEIFIESLKDTFHLKNHPAIFYFISNFSGCSHASKVAAAMERELLKSCSIHFAFYVT